MTTTTRYRLRADLEQPSTHIGHQAVKVIYIAVFGLTPDPAQALTYPNEAEAAANLPRLQASALDKLTGCAMTWSVEPVEVEARG